MSFSKQVGDFSKKSLAACDQTRRGIVIELFNSVIRDTPVGNPELWLYKHPTKGYTNFLDYRDADGYVGGRARGNWQTSLHAPKTNQIERIDPSGVEASSEVLSNLGALGDTVYMSNNLPYIERLEDGYSTQAPAGMMKKNIARISQIIRKQIRKNKL